jgi:hypothetical protein
MPTKTTNIAVANLSVAEKWFDHFDAEMHTDTSGSNRVAVIDNIPGIWNAGTSRFDQRNIVYFKNCVLGTTYQFRFRVIDKYGNVGAWSGWISEVAGDTTAPAPSYSPVVTSFPGGVIIKAVPSGAPSDLDRYEHYWNLTGSSPSSTTLPNLPNSRDGVCTIMLSAADTGNAWVRAVDTSGNKQAWTSQGAFLSTGGVPYLFPVGKNMLANPGFESNVVGTPLGSTVAAGNALSDGWTVAEQSAYHETFLFTGQPRSGGLSILERLKLGVTIPNDSTFYPNRVVTLTKLPVTIGDILRVSGWEYWGNDTAIPGGITIIQRIGVYIYDATNTFLGAISNDVTNGGSGFNAWNFLQAALLIPATLGGGVPSYALFSCGAFVKNASGAGLATGVHTYADCVFDDVKCVLQSTAFDLTPLNTSGTFTGASPLSQVGVTTAINIAASTMQFGDGQISFNSGSVNPGSMGTWYIYADDPTYSGGAVTYAFTNSQSATYAANGRIYFGKITTSGGGGGAGAGGGSGGGRLQL